MGSSARIDAYPRSSSSYHPSKFQRSVFPHLENFGINENSEFRTRREDDDESDPVENHVDEEVENNEIDQDSHPEKESDGTEVVSGEDEGQNDDEEAYSSYDGLSSLDGDDYNHESLETSSSEDDSPPHEVPQGRGFFSGLYDTITSAATSAAGSFLGGVMKGIQGDYSNIVGETAPTEETTVAADEATTEEVTTEAGAEETTTETPSDDATTPETPADDATTTEAPADDATTEAAAK
ncbi:uncharacterized protein LOC118434059 [Folsomia candida]|uniref:uncharacterized protein LOC118434059 n=1 Tax=Folsomia candida TaxID=158441 RepID=UPI001604D8BC|nr:uncharacterized protein LOC118434059 [Folsomia candida]